MPYTELSDPKTEQQALGAALGNSGLADRVATLLTVVDFTDDRNVALYSAREPCGSVASPSTS